MSVVNDIAAAFAPQLDRCTNSACGQILVPTIEDILGWTLYGIKPQGVRKYQGFVCSVACGQALSTQLGSGMYRLYRPDGVHETWTVP